MSAYQNPSSQSLRSNLANVALPPKLRCTLCKKYKARTAFSNKEINDWQYIHGRDGNPEAIGDRIRCRTCAGGPKMEMTCTSCHITQGIENFSKTQRSQADARCRDCISWFDNTEPGVIPLAAPETENAPDEEYLEAVTRSDSFGLDNLDIEGEPDSDEEDEILNRKDELLSVGDSARTASHASDHGHFLSKTKTKTSRSHHTTSSPSNPYESSGEIPVSREASIPSWSTPNGVNTNRNVGVEYNAYDPRGNLHIRQQSIPSSHASGAHGLVTARALAQGPAPTPTIEYTKHGWPKKVNQLKPKAPKPEFHLTRDQPKSALQLGILDDDDESDDSM